MAGDFADPTFCQVERQDRKQEAPFDPAGWQGVQAVFFDAAGTLIHLPRGVGFHYAKIAETAGWNIDPATLDSCFLQAWRRAAPPLPSRAPRADDDRSWWCALVENVLDLASAPMGLDRDRYFAAVYEEFVQPGVWTLEPEAPSILAELQRYFTLGIVSNFDARLRSILRDLDVLHFFQHVIISSEVGADKPHPWIFNAALLAAKCSPAQALLVGDDPHSDVAGAKDAGWHSFHFKPPHSTLRQMADMLIASRSGS